MKRYTNALDTARENLKLHTEEPINTILTSAESIKGICKILRNDPACALKLHTIREDLAPCEENALQLDILRHYGGLQRIVCIEEMAELMVEICQDIQGSDNRGNILEEHADVTNMLTQMQCWYGIDPAETRLAIEEKLIRQKKRIMEESKPIWERIATTAQTPSPGIPPEA